MPEALCDVGRGVTLCYETFGDPADPTALLVMGLGVQMIGWREDFCAELAGRGFHVVRYDNRDAGRSTRLARHPPPTAPQGVRRPAPAARPPAAAPAPPPTRSTTWPPTGSGCSTASASAARTSSARRWAG